MGFLGQLCPTSESTAKARRNKAYAKQGEAVWSLRCFKAILFFFATPLPLRAFAVDVLLANVITPVAWLFGVVCPGKAVTIEASIDFEYFAILVTLPDTWQNLLQMSAT